MKLDVNLTDLLCEQCRNKSVDDVRQMSVIYSRSQIELPDSKSGIPIRVSLDVRRIDFYRQQRGIYQAYAIITAPCIECKKTHTLRNYVQAVRVLLTNTGTCGKCNSALELEDESITYLDDAANKPRIEMKGRLICNRCKAIQHEEVQFQSSSIDSISKIRGLKIDIHSSKAFQYNPYDEYVRHKRFDVAFSFSGDRREFVSEVATILCSILGKDRVFYDKNFEAELARVNLDVYLQKIYNEQSELIVVFLCDEYERRKWCGLEWRTVRDLIFNKQESDIMLMRFDEAKIPGIFQIDGYVDLRDRNPRDAAMLILDRLLIKRATEAS